MLGQKVPCAPGWKKQPVPTWGGLLECLCCLWSGHMLNSQGVLVRVIIAVMKQGSKATWGGKEFIVLAYISRLTIEGR